MVVCVCLGSVSVPVSETVSAIAGAIKGIFTGVAPPETTHATVILAVRLPRVLAVALTGAALSLCGAAVQGLLRNPLADASNLGVSSGAAVGAALSIAFGFSIPGFFQAGTKVSAMVFAVVSLIFILSLSYRIDYSLSTNTIILIGLIYTMFASSVTSLVITFAGEKVQSIVFWMMGSLSGAKYRDVIVLLAALVVRCGDFPLRAGAQRLRHRRGKRPQRGRERETRQIRGAHRRLRPRGVCACPSAARSGSSAL